ncbi:MAG: dicarboxylate/amino acid:cation symporter [Myxococcota bacterium]|nr:dicarboxylate/amino acid:cation symporter [Myxococcota bacterium]
MRRLFRSYGFSMLLLGSIIGGLLLGSTAPEFALSIRPLGEFFLNLIFMMIVPLVFFTLASSVVSSLSGPKLGRVYGWTFIVFFGTGLIASILALGVMLVFAPSPGEGLELSLPTMEEPPPLLEQVVKTFTVPDFVDMLSRKALLPLIVFSIAVGAATRASGEGGKAFAQFLQSGAQVFVQVIRYVMFVAPVGLFAYFAATVVDTGEHLATAYLSVFVIYYVFAAGYYLLAFSGYAFLAGGKGALGSFWSQMAKPSLTALGTCSSMATMPVNLEAAPKMGVPSTLSAVVIPMGAALHKDGSVIGGVLKILFALSLFGQELSAPTLLAVVLVAVLVGVVMGAIPSGGMIGELLILSVFGFPPEALPLLAIISVIIDPAATVLNAAGDNAAAMLVARLSEGKDWRS